MNTLTPFPVLAGMDFRTAHGPEDAVAFAAIHRARMAVDGVDPDGANEMVGTEAEYREALAAARDADALALRPVAEMDGRVAAFGKIESWTEADGTAVYLLMGWTHPGFRGRGIGGALLGWMEGEARELARRDRPGARGEFAANASSTETSAAALLADMGYRAAYTVAELRLDRAAFLAGRGAVPALPPGLSVSRPEPAEYRALAAAVHRAFVDEYDGGRFDESAGPEAYAAGLAGEDRDPSRWLVARHGGDIVGVVLIDPDSAGGHAFLEVKEVAVVPEWRRRGLARALLSLALDAIVAADPAADLRICTVAQFKTRAIDLYGSLGFRRHKDFPRYRKPMDPGLHPQAQP